MLKTKFLIQNGFIMLYIPENAHSNIEFDKFKRAKNIFDFLHANQMKSDLTEVNFDYMEKFIEVYKSEKYFTGVSINNISFENILYPYAAIEESSKFKIVLPMGNPELYWEKMISNIADRFFNIENIQELSELLAKESQVKPALLQRIFSNNSGLFGKADKKETPLDVVKTRSKLIRLLAREYPPQAIPKDIIKAIENIPYRLSESNKKRSKVMSDLKEFGGLEIKEIKAVYLNPIRVKTLDKIISMFKINKDLRNININEIWFDSNQTIPSVKFNEKQTGYILTLSDFATQNNIYDALKNVPMK